MPLEHLCELTPVVALLSFEQLKTTIGNILHHALFLSYAYFLVCLYLILYFFTYLYMCIYIEGPLFHRTHSSIPTENNQRP